MLNLHTKRFAFAAIVMAASLSLSACFSDGGDDEVAVAATDLTVAASASTLAAVVGTTYTFPAMAELGTTSTTTVTFTSATATPAFSISSSEGTATGTTTFGSCYLLVGESSYPANHLLARGAMVRINPCEVQVSVKGLEVGSNNMALGTRLQMGSVLSGPVSKPGSLSATGVVVINGAVLGTVNVTIPTGATGGGS